jgi:hypothetical protein
MQLALHAVVPFCSAAVVCLPVHSLTVTCRCLLHAAGVLCRYAYLLPAIPPGCRRAVVLLRGRGPQPGFNSSSSSVTSSTSGCGSGGGRGTKFACAQLSFVRQADIAKFGADACMASWADKQVTGP